MPGNSNGGRVDAEIEEPTEKMGSKGSDKYFPWRSQIKQSSPAINRRLCSIQLCQMWNSPGIPTNPHHLALLGSAEDLGNLQAVPCWRFGVGYFSTKCCRFQNPYSNFIPLSAHTSSSSNWCTINFDALFAVIDVLICFLNIYFF